LASNPSLNDQAVVYFDGLCEPRNPGGVATYGIVIYQKKKILYQEAGMAEAQPWTLEASNNVAEYSAVIRALEWLSKGGYQDRNIILRGDSRLIINQLNGKFKVRAKRLIELHNRAKKLLAEFGNVRLEWVRRELNKEADLLSRIAYSDYLRAQGKNKRPAGEFYC
jgi:ribonuclease HI